MKRRHVESIISLLSFSPGFSSPVRALKRRLGLCWLCPDPCEQAVIHSFSKALVIMGHHLFWFFYSVLLESCLFYPSNHLTSTLSTSTTSLIRLYDIPHLAALPPFGPHQPHQKMVWHLWKALRKDIFDVSNSQTCQDFLTQNSILFLGPKNQRFCRILLQIADCLPLGPKTLDILMGGTLAGPGTIFSNDIWPFNISLIKQVSTSHWVYLLYICKQKSLKSRSVITQLCMAWKWSKGWAGSRQLSGV